MLSIILAIGYGFFAGNMIEKQISYCECFRDQFKGAYCQKIKGSETQGSCKSK